MIAAVVVIIIVAVVVYYNFSKKQEKKETNEDVDADVVPTEMKMKEVSPPAQSPPAQSPQFRATPSPQPRTPSPPTEYQRKAHGNVEETRRKLFEEQVDVEDSTADGTPPPSPGVGINNPQEIDVNSLIGHLQTTNVQGDGSCLLHSLLYLVDDEYRSIYAEHGINDKNLSELGRAYRDELLNYYRRKKNIINVDHDDDYAKHLKSKEMLDDRTLKLLDEIENQDHDIYIKIIDSKESILETRSCKPDRNTYILVQLSGNHYTPLYEERRNGENGYIFQYGDDEFSEYLKSMKNVQCENLAKLERQIALGEPDRAEPEQGANDADSYGVDSDGVDSDGVDSDGVDSDGESVQTATTATNDDVFADPVNADHDKEIFTIYDPENIDTTIPHVIIDFDEKKTSSKQEGGKRKSRPWDSIGGNLNSPEMQARHLGLRQPITRQKSNPLRSIGKSIVQSVGESSSNAFEFVANSLPATRRSNLDSFKEAIEPFPLKHQIEVARKKFNFNEVRSLLEQTRQKRPRLKSKVDYAERLLPESEKTEKLMNGMEEIRTELNTVIPEGVDSTQFNSTLTRIRNNLIWNNQNKARDWMKTFNEKYTPNEGDFNRLDLSNDGVPTLIRYSDLKESIQLLTKKLDYDGFEYPKKILDQKQKLLNMNKVDFLNFKLSEIESFGQKVIKHDHDTIQKNLKKVGWGGVREAEITNDVLKKIKTLQNCGIRLDLLKQLQKIIQNSDKQSGGVNTRRRNLCQEAKEVQGQIADITEELHRLALNRVEQIGPLMEGCELFMQLIDKLNDKNEINRRWRSITSEKECRNSASNSGLELACWEESKGLLQHMEVQYKNEIQKRITKNEEYLTLLNDSINYENPSINSELKEVKALNAEMEVDPVKIQMIKNNIYETFEQYKQAFDKLDDIKNGIIGKFKERDNKISFNLKQQRGDLNKFIDIDEKDKKLFGEMTTELSEGIQNYGENYDNMKEEIDKNKKIIKKMKDIIQNAFSAKEAEEAAEAELAALNERQQHQKQQQEKERELAALNERQQQEEKEARESLINKARKLLKHLLDREDVVYLYVIGANRDETIKNEIEKMTSEVQGRGGTGSRQGGDQVYKGKGGAALPQLNFKLSDENIKKFQKFGFFNVLKYVRFKYYNKEEDSAKDTSGTLVFKVYADFLLTTIVCIFLQAAKEETLAAGAMVDQLASMGLYWKFQDPRLILLPYYAPFL